MRRVPLLVQLQPESSKDACQQHVQLMQSRGKGVFLEGRTISAAWKGHCDSLAQLLHLLVQQAPKELPGEDLAAVQARLVPQPLPHLR